jgi:hypothetical protein
MSHWLDSFDRAALIAKAVALGFDEAQANLWLDRLLASRSGVKQDKAAVIIAALDGQIAAITLQRNRTIMGRQWVVDNAPNNVVKTATLASIDEVLGIQLKRIERLQRERDELS